MKNKKSIKTKKKNLKRSSDTQQNYEMIGLFLIILGVISFISMFNTNMGLIGKSIERFFVFLAGKGKLTISFLILGIGILFLIKKTKYSKRKILFLILWIFVSVIIILDKNTPLNLSLREKLAWLGKDNHLSTSGGYLGALIGYFFYHLFGTTGTFIMIFTVGLVYLLYLTPNSLQAIKKNISNNFKKTIEKNKLKNNFSLESTKHKLSKKSKKIKSLKKLTEKKDEKKELFSDKSANIEILKYNTEDQIISKEQKEKVPPLTQVEKESWGKEINIVPNEKYIFPPEELLQKMRKTPQSSNDIFIENGKIIEKTMDNFNIDCKVTSINIGPVVTCYELEPAPGVRLNKIVSLADNLSLSLASPDIRIEAPIPGKSAVGIEVPNEIRDAVNFRDIIESREFKEASSTPLVLGKDVSGKIIISSIDKMPHLLIAGATGSGKSVCINTILISILYHSTPEEVRLILIDPKVVELNVYNGIPHLLIPVVTDPKKAAFALNWAVNEMEKRYKTFAENSVRDITSYNAKMRKKDNSSEVLPKIIIVIDELSDLMMVSANEVEDYIARLAQMARAAGIYLIIATQRPSVDVITGTIKANIPSRIAFAVSSAVDSRTILDMGGAEKLLGKGDMLFYPSFYSKPRRVQGAFISDEEVENIVQFVSSNSEVVYNEEVVTSINKIKDRSLSSSDKLTPQAIEIVLKEEQASISFVQRKLKVGYSRAARIIDEIEEMGIIGPHEGSKPRKILLSEEDKKKYLEVNNE